MAYHAVQVLSRCSCQSSVDLVAMAWREVGGRREVEHKVAPVDIVDSSGQWPKGKNRLLSWNPWILTWV